MIIDWLKKRFCKHHWIVMYRGRRQELRRCQYCDKTKWFSN